MNGNCQVSEDKISQNENNVVIKIGLILLLGRTMTEMY